MKFYLASRFGRRSELQGYRSKLIELGHEVTSRWLTVEHKAEDTDQPEQPSDAHERFALDDLEDIDKSDALVAFTESPDSTYGRGGRHVELGYALAMAGSFAIMQRRLQVIVVGPRENVFTHLSAVHHYPDAAGFMAFAQGLNIVERHYGRRLH